MATDEGRTTYQADRWAVSFRWCCGGSRKLSLCGGNLEKVNSRRLGSPHDLAMMGIPAMG